MSMWNSSRWVRALLLPAVVMAAYCVTFVWPRQNALDFDIDSSPRVQAARSRVPYDLSQVRVLKAVITRVNQEYVEPQRVVPRKMLMAGLDAIQKTVAPVMVEYHNGESEFTIQVDNRKKKFRASDVNSPWSLTWRFQEIFKFLQDNLEDEDIKLRDVEYAAVNGMLRTLDPHSILLTPEEFSEMKLNTSGEFGGLGIVISIRDAQLTIIRPMPGTPASRAGLKAKDRIVKIDEESTINMPLEEAVKRLRGQAGSMVAVWVVREGERGWTKPRRFDLERAVIHIASVESKMLSNHVGLLRVKSFQSNTCDDAKQVLDDLHEEGMRALILDMRDNPGGLLQQAVCVADLFITTGTIVTTASNDPDKQERKLARPEDTEPSYPMVALVNGGSASASEIVAGALQSHDRALVVGQKTFGKGSVQELYSDEADRWALKLTVAQYLTPGDVSIQGVGIVPDISIDPMTVDKLDMDLTVKKQYMRESDLTAHLTHARAHEPIKPSVTLRYYLPSEIRQRLQEASPEDAEENLPEDEFLTRFSRDLLARAVKVDRGDMLLEAKPVIDQARVQEMKHAEKELKKLGVDWSPGPDQGPSEVEAKVSTNRPDNRARAGEPFELQVEVTNKGKAPLFQLRAVTKSDSLLFNERELAFGRLGPGETRKWSTTLGVCRTKDGKPNPEGEKSCKLPRSMPRRADGIRVEFAEAHEHAPAAVEIRTEVEALPKPQFAYLTHLVDNIRGNGDGQLQRGEFVTLYLVIRNVGQGRSYAPLASLRNLSGRGVLLHDGRFQLTDMNPGEQRIVAFTFETLPDFDQSEAKLQISVGDTEISQVVGEKLQIPVASGASQTPSPHSGRAIIKSNAAIWEQPAPEARIVAHVQGGSVVLPADAALNGFKRVDLGNRRRGWVDERQIVQASAEPKGKIIDYFDHMPPRVQLDSSNTLVTREPSLVLRGRAIDDVQVRDLYIFAGTRKVFYQSNRDAADHSKVEFNTEVQLRPGINYITVVARESEGSAARDTFVVRRDSPNGSLLETPKTDEDLYVGEGE